MQKQPIKRYPTTAHLDFVHYVSFCSSLNLLHVNDSWCDRNVQMHDSPAMLIPQQNLILSDNAN